MPRPAFEIFRVTHSLSFSGPASSSLHRPRRLSPFLHNRRPNRSCRVTPRHRVNGPVGAIFLATMTSSSLCAVLAASAISPPPGATLTLLARTNKANLWILGRTQEDIYAMSVLASSSQRIRWLRNSRSAILLRVSVANALRTDRGKLRFSDAQLHLQFWRAANIRVHQQLARNLFRASEPGYCRGSRGHRACDTQRLSITQLPRCGPQPLPLDLSALSNLDAWAAYLHLLMKLLRSLVSPQQRKEVQDPTAGSYLSNAPGVLDLNSFKIASP